MSASSTAFWTLTGSFSNSNSGLWTPVIGERRPPSKLGDLQPDHWLAEYTTELMNVLNVLGRLVDLEQSQADLLEWVYSAQTISADELREAGALAVDVDLARRSAVAHSSRQTSLLD